MPSSPITGTPTKSSATCATTSKSSPSPCALSKPGARCSKTISALTTPPAAACGFWTWSPVPQRSRGCPEPARASALPKRILLIDDTPEIAQLLTFALRDHGHEVFAEGFTDTVNDLIRDLKADALVLDCSTFDMSESLFDLVRHNPDYAELPIVIISDTPEKADASLTARNAQKVLLIPKPFTGSQVARALSGTSGNTSSARSSPTRETGSGLWR